MSTDLIYGPSQLGKQGKRRAVPPSTHTKCGTYAGYLAHYKVGTKPCEACTHAHTVYQGQWRVRSGRSKRAMVPYEVLGALLNVAPTEIEEWAEGELGDAVTTRALEAFERQTAETRHAG